jgi:hypothetical protein
MELIWKLLEHLRIDRGLPVHILVISLEDRTFTDAIVGRETTKSGTETVLAPGFGPRGSCSDQYIWNHRSSGNRFEHRHITDELLEDAVGLDGTIKRDATDSGSARRAP